MKSDAEFIDWDHELAGKNTQQMWDTLESKLMALVTEYVPKRKPSKKRSGNKPLWMNDKAYTKVRRKYYSHKRYRTTPEGENYSAYARDRNQAKWEVKRAVREYEKKLALEVKQNPKAFYKYASSKLKTRTTIPDLTMPDGTRTNTDRDKAEVLNDFFSSVFSQEDLTSMPIPEAKKMESFLEQIQISEEDIMKRLHKLKINKSAGPDSMHPRLLKELSNELTKPLELLFHKSSEEALIPQQWKKSHVSPIYKNGHRMQANNYRPVSLTSIICKLLEKIVRQAVMEHLIDNGLINDNQHGFVPGRSCITQLLVVLDHWTDILDDHGALDAIYLDFAKAFDKVPHERLLLKVENHGIKGNALKWIRDFLSNRQQRVVINGTHSAWAPVTSGIPQGSVLGPLLFVIFVNDMPDVMKSFLCMFADDAKPRAPNCLQESTRPTALLNSKTTSTPSVIGLTPGNSPSMPRNARQCTWGIITRRQHTISPHLLVSHNSNLPRQKKTSELW